MNRIEIPNFSLSLDDLVALCNHVADHSRYHYKTFKRTDVFDLVNEIADAEQEEIKASALAAVSIPAPESTETAPAAAEGVQNV